jgi:hypothetical protein
VSKRIGDDGLRQLRVALLEYFLERVETTPRVSNAGDRVGSCFGRGVHSASHSASAAVRVCRRVLTS